MGRGRKPGTKKENSLLRIQIFVTKEQSDFLKSLSKSRSKAARVCIENIMFALRESEESVKAYKQQAEEDPY